MIASQNRQLTYLTIAARDGEREAWDGLPSRSSQWTSSLPLAKWSPLRRRNMPTCSGRLEEAARASSASSSDSDSRLDGYRCQCIILHSSSRPRAISRKSFAGYREQRESSYRILLHYRWLTQTKHSPQVDLAVEIVCLAFTRGRLFPDTANDKTKDPMETMTVLRATALVDTVEHAEHALAFMEGCPRLKHAEVAVHMAATSLAQECGKCDGSQTDSRA